MKIALLILLGLAAVAAVITTICALITHVVMCILIEAWILLVFGVFFFPIGIIHGVGVWLGVF